MACIAQPQVALGQTVEARMNEVWLPWSADKQALPLTGAEYRTLQRRLLSCWRPPAESIEAAGPAAELRVLFDRIGFPTGSEIINPELMALDPLFRDVALSARQAIADCGRLPLPQEKYETWRETVFFFDPSGQLSRPSGRVFRSGADGADMLHIREIDSVRTQIMPCWNPPAGAPNAKDLFVEVRLFLAPNGEVKRIDLLDPERAKSDRSHRVAAQAAVRAVKRCTPLTGLPPSKYEHWKMMVLRFDPSELIGE